VFSHFLSVSIMRQASFDLIHPQFPSWCLGHSGGEGSHLPEPGVALLLALGDLTLIRRRSARQT
jgi:hypothetical protein